MGCRRFSRATTGGVAVGAAELADVPSNHRSGWRKRGKMAGVRATDGEMANRLAGSGAQRGGRRRSGGPMGGSGPRWRRRWW